jgi:predicted adenine nucleotide alpha hydrolase (AANH) superfamily ATPase
MEETAKYAAQQGYDSFTTSLLISPYQNHAAIAATAQSMGEKYGVTFLYRDFRPLFQAGQEFAREHGMYMQKYCGCIFSEEDRYLAAKRKKKARQQNPQ